MSHHMQSMSGNQSPMATSGGIGLNEKDLMQIMLREHKYMISTLATTIMETTDPQLRQQYITQINTDFDHQRMIWEAMNQRGWYPVQMASPQELHQTQQKLTQQTMQQQNMAQQNYSSYPQSMPSHMQQHVHSPYTQANSYTQRP